MRRILRHIGVSPTDSSYYGLVGVRDCFLLRLPFFPFARHVMSCHVLSCPAMSCHVMSSHVICPVTSCHVMSFYVMFCRVMSCSVLSCPVCGESDSRARGPPPADSSQTSVAVINGISMMSLSYASIVASVSSPPQRPTSAYSHIACSLL